MHSPLHKVKHLTRKRAEARSGAEMSTKIIFLLLSSSFLLAIALSVDPPTSMKSDFVGRVAVVTGANKGIGYHIARQLAASGQFTDVVLACRDGARGEAARRRMESEVTNGGGSRGPAAAALTCLPLSVGDSSSHASFVHAMDERFGRVDVLVNNAAIAYKGSSTVPFEDQCKPTLDVNFRGTVDFTEGMLPLIRRAAAAGDGDARIVNVASMSGRLSQLRSGQLRDQFTSTALSMFQLRVLANTFEADVRRGRGYHLTQGWGDSNYGFSKLALIAATRVWAREEAPNGIRVNCCCPGACATDMSSQRGSRTAEDGARNAVLPATMPREGCPTGEFFENMKISRW